MYTKSDKYPELLIDLFNYLGATKYVNHVILSDEKKVIWFIIIIFDI